MKFSAAALCCALLAGLMPTTSHAFDIDMRMPAHRFMEFKLPGAGGSTQDLAVGPDRNFWVIQQNPARLLRVSPLGELSKIPLPPASNPHSPVFDSAGNLWIVFKARNTIGQVSIKSGRVLKEFSVTQPECPDVAPQGLALGADGTTLWFAGTHCNSLAKLDTAKGSVTHYPLPGGGGKPTVTSPDRAGNIWFNQTEGDRLGYMNAEGFMFDYPAPEGSTAPSAIVPDPKEPRVWFSLASGGLFGSADTAGNINTYPVPSSGAKLAGLGFDRKGLMWLAYQSPDIIALVRGEQSVKEFALPTLDAKLRRILLGPDGNMWFVEAATDKLGYVFDTADYSK